MSLKNQQLILMLQLQAKLNAKINPGWATANYQYLRAVIVEGGEAIEHHGYKWWKAQLLNLPQLQMEVIDIWHFLLSDMLVRVEGDVEMAEEVITAALTGHDGVIVFDGIEGEIGSMSLLDKIELVIGLAVVRRISFPLFESIMIDCEMTWDGLFKQYMSKNVLNIFRQDYGYKQGSYIKIWDGREDNEHLVEILSNLDSRDVQFENQLYEGLRTRYSALTQ